MQGKAYIEGDKVVFDCGNDVFVRDVDCLLKMTGSSSMDGLMDVIDDFLATCPDEESLRERFGAGIEDAIILATTLFYGRTDLDGLPMALHSLEVGRAGKTRDEMIVGYIHDVVEDTGTTFDDLLRMGYTRRVVEAAKLCTRAPEVPYEVYLNGIIASGNTIALNVKINDLNHNLSRGKKTEAEAEKEGNTALLERIRAINAKHERAIETIKKSINL